MKDIMFDIYGKFQASIFIDASDITPTSPYFSKLFDILKDRGLLPSIVQENNSIITPNNAHRLRLQSPTNLWSVTFLSNRIDIEKMSVIGEPNSLGDISNFIEEVNIIFCKISSVFAEKGSRIALITGGLLKEMDSASLSNVYNKIFSVLPFYNENIPFEWSWKSTSKSIIKINNEDESINVNTFLNRGIGKINLQTSFMDYDRVVVDFDLNSVMENESKRFSLDSLHGAFISLLNIRSEIIDQINHMINE